MDEDWFELKDWLIDFQENLKKTSGDHSISVMTLEHVVDHMESKENLNNDMEDLNAEANSNYMKDAI